MQSLRQYNEIGRFVESTYNGDEKSKNPDRESSIYPASSQHPPLDLERQDGLPRGDGNPGPNITSIAPHTSTERIYEPRSWYNSNPSSCSSSIRSHSSRRGTQHPSDEDIFVYPCGPDDPSDPHNWPLRTRCLNLALISLLVFVQGWAGGADSMGNASAADALHVSRVAETLNTGMFLLGIGVGAMFAGPLTETFGRNMVFLSGTGVYMLFILGSAVVADFAGQIVCRFFAGLFASATLAVNGSGVSDQFRVKERSVVFPLLALANILPVALAPVAGGWIVESHLDYRWMDKITLIISFPAWLLALLFLRESYSPLLVTWKAQQMRRITGDERYTSVHECRDSLLARLRETLPRPIVFFMREPVIAVLGIYLVLLYALLFIFLSGFEFLFADTYGFSPGHTGTVFVAIAAGAIFGTALTPVFCVVERRALHRRRLETGLDVSFPPEVRLWPAIVASPPLFISLFWLGWTNYAPVSPWAGIAACFVLGYALIAVYIGSYQYILDSYGPYAASALASITMVRYMVAGGIHVAGIPIFRALGTHWTLTMVGAIALVLAAAPYLFYRYGEILRGRSKYAGTA